jgi:hypothetical protein
MCRSALEIADFASGSAVRSGGGGSVAQIGLCGHQGRDDNELHKRQEIR